ncbi:MAG: hypothetical protein NT106_02390, partial [Candidatus Sumerlaeota bacterium]|nr:hypothetical protein [Candidatus Sumerlaeota bacterium]
GRSFCSQEREDHLVRNRWQDFEADEIGATEVDANIMSSSAASLSRFDLLHRWVVRQSNDGPATASANNRIERDFGTRAERGFRSSSFVTLPIPAEEQKALRDVLFFKAYLL